MRRPPSSGLVLIGCGPGAGGLTPQARAALAGATVIAGGRRLLGLVRDLPGERVVLAAGLDRVLDRLVARARTCRVAVLASGDPLFFGIAATLARRRPDLSFTIVPAVSSLQAACARAALPWHDLRPFSVHGRTAALPWRRILTAPAAAVLCDGGRTPATIARDLIARCPEAASRPAWVMADLDLPGERVWRGTLAAAVRRRSGSDLALLLLPHSDRGRPGLPLGLDEDAYAHEARLITKPEVRAVALAKLRLRPGVLWDLGAGSGSVGIEAAGLCEGLRVIAVERSPPRCRQITVNAATHGVEVAVVAGEARHALRDLPDPDAVFVGGGGAEVAALVTAALRRLRPGGRVVASAVLLDTQAALLRVAPRRRVEVVQVAVARGRSLAGAVLPTAENPITLFLWERP